MPPRLHSSRAAQARSSISHRWWASRPRLNGVYGATKAFVIALSHSLQHELGDQGIRIQAVLPGATATDLWELAGRPWQQLSAEIVMPVEDMVDAALAGLDQGERVTIPGLQDGEEWNRFEAARRALSQRLSTSRPAPRYGIVTTARDAVPADIIR